MDSQQKLINIVKTLDSKKADRIEAIEIGDLTIIADYFVIASGTSSTHVRTLADEVEFKLKELGESPTRIEGYDGSNWIAVDYSDIVVHIFNKETREYYSLERLWNDGRKVEINDYITK